MKIRVRVSANAKKPKVLSLEGENALKVWVDAPALDGKANKRLAEILAQYYGRPKSCFAIASGMKSRNKIVEIRELNGHQR